ncbi:MAG: Abi family protein [Bacilli bacterium]|nr:Abi family protein [Bacilli bacterium]
MTKEQFLSKIIFNSNEERDDALFYIKVKGLSLHKEIYDYLLKENNNQAIIWKQISDELRLDKGLRDTLYIYLATLEEYIRAYISNKYENDLNQSFWINGKGNHNSIKDNITKGKPLFEILQDTDLGTLIQQVQALPRSDKDELFGGVGTNENLQAVKELRNCIGHHKFLKTYNFKSCTVDGYQSNSLENNIKNLRQLLPERYRHGKNGHGGITADLRKFVKTI